MENNSEIKGEPHKNSRAAQYVSHMVRWDKWNIVDQNEKDGVHRLIILETGSGDEIETLIIEHGEEYLDIPDEWDYLEAEKEASQNERCPQLKIPD